MNTKPNTPASRNEVVAMINGEPATAHSLLAALVDIHDDEQKNAPEDRCYVGRAWGDCMRTARAFLASAITTEPSLKECADALMAAGHAFWQACRRDAGGGAVRWLNATDGTTIIFTRGEYAATLLSGIKADYQAPETVFEQPVGDDERGGIVARIAAPGAAIDAGGQEPVISVEDSLRTRLRWSQEKVEQLEQENRELRGRLPGPSFDDLMACTAGRHPLASRPEAPPASASPATVGDEIHCICGCTWGNTSTGWEIVDMPPDASPATVARVTMAQIASQEDAVAEVEEIHARLGALRTRLNAIAPATVAQPAIGMRDAVYVDSTPHLHVGSSSFEDWFQAHPKACTGDKQLARDAYAAGMGDPLVIARDAAQPCASQGCGGAVSERPCRNCDDTGDVHSITGEWRGVCHCPAGQAIKARRLAAPVEQEAALQYPEALACLSSVLRAASHVVVTNGARAKLDRLREVVSKASEWLAAEQSALSTAKSVEHGATDGGTGE